MIHEGVVLLGDSRGGVLKDAGANLVVDIVEGVAELSKRVALFDNFVDEKELFGLEDLVGDIEDDGGRGRSQEGQETQECE